MPRSVGRYLLGDELGSGGMAVVHLGATAGALGFARVVAIKTMHATITGDPAFRQAIVDEARIVARIRHPNVVGVVDVLADGDDVALVLEYVHGESLAVLAKRAEEQRSGLAIGVAVAIAIDVLHGLNAAHRATDEHGVPLEVVHRDVSPQNILVGVDGTARVLDFGVAKARNRVAVTRDGAVKGKLEFMAPEQIGGEATAQSDLYAVGILLWQMLAGRSPFAASQTPTELLALALQGVGVAPSVHRAGIPSSLDAVVMRALSPRPSDRFRSAGAMAESLERADLAAPRDEISAFVGELAHRELTKRSEQMSALEKRARTGDGDPALVLPETDRRAPTAIPTAAVVTTVVPPRHRGRRALTVAVFVLALAAAGAVAARGRERPHAPITDSLPALAASTPENAPSSAPLVAPSILAAEPTASGAAVSAAPVSRPRPPPRAGRAATASSSAAPDCSTPYVVDANGYRSYRRECFPK